MSIRIVPVRAGDRLYAKTADLAKRCSFQGSGQYLCGLMEANELTAVEQVFCAADGETVVGFCALMEESCGESAHTPWLDFLFVEESRRHQGIAKRLIEEAGWYAAGLGFSELYLCTNCHEDFYRRLGFSTIGEKPINEHTTGKIMRLAQIASKGCTT